MTRPQGSAFNIESFKLSVLYRASQVEETESINLQRLKAAIADK